MRCEVNLDENNVIRNAVSTGTMWRGLEVILKGRDPRDAWAFTERICGVCTGTHALTSVRAVEDALGIQIPENANSIRNIMQLTLQAHDHLVHFYHLHALDWVDVVSALKADPKATSELAQSISQLAAVLARLFPRRAEPAQALRGVRPARPLHERLLGQSGLPAAAGGQPDGGRRTIWRRSISRRRSSRSTPIYGGKNPHPNWLVGGVPCAINVHDTGRGRRDQHGAAEPGLLHHRPHHRVHRPGLHPRPAGHRVLLQGLDLRRRPQQPVRDVLRRHPGARQRQFSPRTSCLPRGAIINGNLDEVHDVDLRDPEQIQEFVAHSWFSYADETKGLHPWDGVTEPNFVLGPNTKGTRTHRGDRRGRQVLLDQGPALARPRHGGRAAGALGDRLCQGHPGVQGAGREGADRSASAGHGALLHPGAHRRARPGSRSWAAHKLRYFQDKLVANIKAGDSATANIDKWDPATWPKEAKGVGHDRSPARRARALDRHQGRTHRELPGGGADHLERLAARPGRQHRRLRGGADEHPARQGATSRWRSCAPCTASTPASPARPMS